MNSRRFPGLPTAALLLTAGAMIFLAGCGGRSRALARQSGNFYAVSVAQTSFFRFGPQQGSGPDQQLVRDTLVTVIRPSFGYCKVRLAEGTEGYVASDDIRPAPATLLAALAEPSPSPEAPQFSFRAADPELIPPEESLPAPDVPAVEEPVAASPDPVE